MGVYNICRHFYNFWLNLIKPDVWNRQNCLCKRRIHCKTLVNLEKNTSGTICIEVTISIKKWCIIFVSRPPHSNNKKVFFSELSTSLNQATNKYDNIIVIGDLNIDTQKNEADTNYLPDLCDTFALANLIRSSTCSKSLSGTSIDMFLTNRTRSFHNTAITETGISDHHILNGHPDKTSWTIKKQKTHTIT